MEKVLLEKISQSRSELEDYMRKSGFEVLESVDSKNDEDDVKHVTVFGRKLN